MNALLGLTIDDDDVDTIGGWILTKNIEISEGDTIKIENYKFCVKKLDGHYIKRLEVTKPSESIVIVGDEKRFRSKNKLVRKLCLVAEFFEQNVFWCIRL